MTTQQILAFGVIGLMMAVFIWDRFRYDLVAGCALVLAIAVGLVPFDKAFSGFSDDIVIIVGSALVVSAGVARSGIVDTAIKRFFPNLDTLHTQLNTLDSVWAFEVKAKNKSPIRFIALGRDATSIAHGEDNEPTGLFVSNGSADPKHLLGTAESLEHARGFFTQQHADNNLYEIVPITGPVAMRN